MIFSVFKVSGHSMQPSLPHGSLVIVSSLPFLFHDPAINDIIAFVDKTSKKIFIKRISKIDGNRYFLSGDNQGDSLDGRKLGWVERKAIIGKVIFYFK